MTQILDDGFEISDENLSIHNSQDPDLRYNVIPCLMPGSTIDYPESEVFPIAFNNEPYIGQRTSMDKGCLGYMLYTNHGLYSVQKATDELVGKN